MPRNAISWMWGTQWGGGVGKKEEVKRRTAPDFASKAKAYEMKRHKEVQYRLRLLPAMVCIVFSSSNMIPCISGL